MTTKTKFAAALAALTLAATVALPTTEAQAGHRGWGWGLAGAAIGTAIVAGSVANAYAEPVYVDGYRSCAWRARYDAFGNFIGNVKVCRYY
jgi:hypothetical protein